MDGKIRRGVCVCCLLVNALFVDRHGLTALELAAVNGYPHPTTALLEEGARVNYGLSANDSKALQFVAYLVARKRRWRRDLPPERGVRCI